MVLLHVCATCVAFGNSRGNTLVDSTTPNVRSSNRAVRLDLDVQRRGGYARATADAHAAHEIASLCVETALEQIKIALLCSVADSGGRGPALVNGR